MDQTEVLELIEGAAREHLLCDHCGESMIPVARDGAVWLECSSIAQSSSRLRRLFALDLVNLHTRVRVTDLRTEANAA